MKDADLMEALRRCLDAEVCDTDCPGYAYCIGGGGNIMDAAAERIDEQAERIEMFARVIEGFKPMYVYFAVDKPLFDMMEQLPEAGVIGFYARHKRGYIPLIDKMGWGVAIYSRRLTGKELDRCGLISAPRGMT